MTREERSRYCRNRRFLDWCREAEEQEKYTLLVPNCWSAEFKDAMYELCTSYGFEPVEIVRLTADNNPSGESGEFIVYKFDDFLPYSTWSYSDERWWNSFS